MKIISYLPLMLVPLVAACASQSNMTTDDCVPTTHITITPLPAKVSAAPEHICVDRGDTITVTVAGNPKRGSVSTTPEVAKNTWLNGSYASKAG